MVVNFIVGGGGTIRSTPMHIKGNNMFVMPFAVLCCTHPTQTKPVSIVVFRYVRRYR